MDVYKQCHVFKGERFFLRQTVMNDASDLLAVYSDVKAVPFFNSDNCGGDVFYYTTKERMEQAIDYWNFEYSRKGFVRWSIVDLTTNCAIGTIELFHRIAEDAFNHSGVLRLDLRSDYEKQDFIQQILSLILLPSFDLFECDKIITKGHLDAHERVTALKGIGFSLSNDKLYGHDGTPYDNYYVICK